MTEDITTVRSPARRNFLKSSLVAGAWVLGSSTIPMLNSLAADEAGKAGSTFASPFDFWLSIDGTGVVTAYTTVTNLGQGTHAAIAQIVAEELEMSLANVRIEHAPVIKQFHREWPPGITTFASAGFNSALETIAPACAAARQMLLQAAALQWQVDVKNCVAVNAQVTHAATGRSLPYTALIKAAAILAPPEKPVIKSPKDWKVLGQSTPRPDIPARVDGSAVFGIDVQRPGMLMAAVLHAPRFGSSLQSVDDGPALAVKGVRKVVHLPNAVAVVAERYWIAHKAVQLLKPVWQDGAHASINTAEMRSSLLRAVAAGDGKLFPRPKKQKEGAAETAMKEASSIIDTSFDVPFLAHATMEPLNATVEVTATGAQVWLSTQSQTDTQNGVAKALGFQPEQVQIHTQHAGGGFGRRLEHDFAIEAALIAKAAGACVKTIWSRENDMQAGYYRPITAARVQLALDKDHLPMVLRLDTAGPSLLEYTRVTNSPARNGLDWTYIMGWFGSSYKFPLFDTRWTRVDFGVPCSYWRSVGNSQNCFFLEHTLEQAARKAGMDSLEYRRRLLQHNPKAIAFVNALAERAGWNTPLPKGYYRGFAMNGNSFLFSAHIVEIAVSKPGQFRLVKITAGINPGVVANPKAVEAQMMGGTLFGLSAALFGEISFRDGQVEQGNFDSYRLVSLAQTPVLDVMVTSTGDRPEGVGEEGPPSIGPAIANALLAASGKPVTRLPLSQAGWKLMA
ncbi:xanthine dehydrogenase family protein molybdopterin-binding subunit [Undibacterium pigrum]|uniref:Isoquinoline 1-oxidoreductase beta subunit n=1 Tax=Undibacterium pigrum TaxID=401470 RepID=A0A318JWR9_9BURK|nr:molybdopterin cofactor-binding domain-containing protein [Undibacterium pigrum]PXX45155.1 isoquinoline 1-oxidoreductase beta subunit [Undibacterium pigrum]